MVITGARVERMERGSIIWVSLVSGNDRGDEGGKMGVRGDQAPKGISNSLRYTENTPMAGYWDGRRE